MIRPFTSNISPKNISPNPKIHIRPKIQNQKADSVVDLEFVLGGGKSVLKIDMMTFWGNLSYFSPPP